MILITHTQDTSTQNRDTHGAGGIANSWAREAFGSKPGVSFGDMSALAREKTNNLGLPVRKRGHLLTMGEVRGS